MNPLNNKVKQRNDGTGIDYPELRDWSMTSDVMSYFNNTNSTKNSRVCNEFSTFQAAAHVLPQSSKCYIPWLNNNQVCSILN